MAAAALKLLTAEDVEKLPDDVFCELIDGVLIELTPPGGEHAFITSNVSALLTLYVKGHKLGRALTGDPGFILRRNPDTVRAPDIAFLSTERAARVTRWRGYLEVPPDLVVEVISPSNTAAEVQSKVHDWLEFGVRLVWLIYPETRSVQVVKSLQERLDLTEAAVLDGYDIIPGFSAQVSELFD